jgi:diguanylate cyclase (GGDEF)-like protein
MVCTAARRLTRSHGAALILRDGQECVYVAEVAIAPLWKGRRLPLQRCLPGWSILNGEIAIVDDVYADERVRPAAYRRTFVKSELMVPIVAGEPVGAIGVYWGERHHASEREVAVVRALAASAAVALDKLRLSEEVDRRRHSEEDLRELSERDPLTGLLNRRAWDVALSGALRKQRDPMYVALMDLDHFKDFNDRHGHPAGDELLRRAAIAWRRALRTADVLARYGGEEFAILLAGCTLEDALEILDRVRRATVCEQSISIGIARWDGRESGDSLIERADTALYEAKRTGRDRVVLAP